jgi:protein TonB
MAVSRGPRAYDPDERRRWWAAGAAATVLHAAVIFAIVAATGNIHGVHGKSSDALLIEMMLTVKEPAPAVDAVAADDDAPDVSDTTDEQQSANMEAETPAEPGKERVAQAPPMEEPAPVVPPAKRPPRRPSTAAAPSVPEPVEVRSDSVPAEGRPSEAAQASEQPASPSPKRRDGGASAAGSHAEYSAVLRSWLERHRRYPPISRLRRQEGKATLAFVVDRDGKILASRIVRSSGYGLLDEEVVRTLVRAQPLPRPPDSLPGAALEFVVPFVFGLD